MDTLTIREWETLRPESAPSLAGRFLDASASTRELVQRLARARFLKVTELRHGLEIRAFSYVGRVSLGDLSISILPKLQIPTLLNLFRYAYGYRRLNLLSEATYPTAHIGLEDLLIAQLNAEAQELLGRGLHRTYVPTDERLSSPQGRIDLNRFAREAPISATLPCRHHPRVENTLLNRVLMAGLNLGASMTGSLELRRESRRLIAQLEEQVEPVRLDARILDQVRHQMNRLMTAYSSAISIIGLLVDSQNIVLEGQTRSTRLPGFLFNMNSFFQALISRFLRENLEGYLLC